MSRLRFAFAAAFGIAALGYGPTLAGNGDPLVGVEVFVEQAQSGGPPKVVAKGRTGRDGSYTFVSQQRAQYRFMVQSVAATAGQPDWYRFTVVPEGSPPTDGVVHLPAAPASVSGPVPLPPGARMTVTLRYDPGVR